MEYEPCEHRHDSTNPDAFYTSPCAVCEYGKDMRATAISIGLLAVSLVIALIVVWRFA